MIRSPAAADPRILVRHKSLTRPDEGLLVELPDFGDL